MSVREDFIKYIEDNINVDEMSDELQNYWKAFKNVKEKETLQFTDNGKKIIQYLKDNYDIFTAFRAVDIANGIEDGITSRTVSGAMRKLVSDGYVDKISQNPISYILTEKGKNVKIEDTK